MLATIVFNTQVNGLMSFVDRSNLLVQMLCTKKFSVYEYIDDMVLLSRTRVVLLTNYN